jgi:hypothetical protein
MRIRYSPQARDDLHDIFHYLAERSPSGAENVMRAINASIAFLAENPLACGATTICKMVTWLAWPFMESYSTLAPRCRSASICSLVPPPNRAR